MQTGGTIGVLTLIVVGLLRQWIVPGWTYAAMEKDRDYYREIANRSVALADRQTTVAEVLTEQLASTERWHRDDRLQARADVLRREGEQDARERRD